MSWIKTIDYAVATGPLRALYERIKGPGDNVDNIMLAHSLRPHTLEGHMTLYKHVLHHPRNTVDKWLLEAIGVYVSMLNACAYCVEHHFAGMARLLADDERSGQLRTAMGTGALDAAFSTRESSALAYARKLTREPAALRDTDIGSLRQAGWDDGQILEINQVVAYFNYANRTVLGLGVHSDGDIIGLSPGDPGDADSWEHC
ncbi:MAG: peroxidase-related enzyme [Lysobacter sp.]|nr:peroxidase-related enzyme [Lysobacter sp.]